MKRNVLPHEAQIARVGNEIVDTTHLNNSQDTKLEACKKLYLVRGNMTVANLWHANQEPQALSKLSNFVNGMGVQ